MIYSNELNKDSCAKIDPWCVDAFFKLSLDEFDPTNLILDNSWEATNVDLTPAIKAGETITHLLLTESALQFNREDYGRDNTENNGIDCITGDDLSHIISMKYLKDVQQPPVLADGDVYMYDDGLNLFTPFNLQNFVNTTNQRLASLEQRVQTLEQNLLALQQTVANNYQSLSNRLNSLEATTAKPSWAPADAVLTWSNVNYEYNPSPATKGIYGHDPNNNVVGDGRFQ